MPLDSIAQDVWMAIRISFLSYNQPHFHQSCITGMVEMIPNAETLRKIQVQHGVTGSFKDRPLADWLQKHNPKEDEYEKVKKRNKRNNKILCLWESKP